jgi:hypothetical protein
MRRADTVNRWAVVLFLVFGSSLAAVALAQSRPGDDVDWTKAQRLLQRERSGETLSAEDKAYLDHAKEVRQKMIRDGQPPPGAQCRPAGMGPGSRPAPSTKPTGLVPLDQMTAQDKYKGEDGGLYGGGANAPPEAHRKAAEAALAKITPLDSAGKPAANGKIVLLSMGMSNTTQEFSRFVEMARSDKGISPKLVLVDGAQGGQDAARWSDGNLPAWKTMEDRLRAAGVTDPQVQVMWVKHARIQPARFGDYPKHTEELKGHFLASLQLARERFPNLRVAYLSSRIYAGYASTALNPEPYAYESALVVRSLILGQIKGDANVNCDPARGAVKAPLLLWGPYLWADGLTPRKSDGLIWKPQDLGPDGTHPSPTSGRQKVAELLLKFFKTDDLAKGWFLGGK